MRVHLLNHLLLPHPNHPRNPQGTGKTKCILLQCVRHYSHNVFVLHVRVNNMFILLPNIFISK